MLQHFLILIELSIAGGHRQERVAHQNLSPTTKVEAENILQLDCRGGNTVAANLPSFADNQLIVSVINGF